MLFRSHLSSLALLLSMQVRCSASASTSTSASEKLSTSIMLLPPLTCFLFPLPSVPFLLTSPTRCFFNFLFGFRSLFFTSPSSGLAPLRTQSRSLASPSSFTNDPLATTSSLAPHSSTGSSEARSLSLTPCETIAKVSSSRSIPFSSRSTIVFLHLVPWRLPLGSIVYFN